MQKAKKINMASLVLLAFATAALGLALLHSSSARAAVDCAVLPQDTICNASGEAGVMELLKWVLKAMVALVGIAAVGGVIWAGILYLSASDNASQVKQAKTIIVDVAIGLIAFGLMFLVLNWLVPGGVLK